MSFTTTAAVILSSESRTAAGSANTATFKPTTETVTPTPIVASSAKVTTSTVHDTTINDDTTSKSTSYTLPSTVLSRKHTTSNEFMSTVTLPSPTRVSNRPIVNETKTIPQVTVTSERSFSYTTNSTFKAEITTHSSSTTDKVAYTSTLSHPSLTVMTTVNTITTRPPNTASVTLSTVAPSTTIITENVVCCRKLILQANGSAVKYQHFTLGTYSFYNQPDDRYCYDYLYVIFSVLVKLNICILRKGLSLCK